MITIGTAQTASTAAPSAFFARWADMATWPEWNADTEWVRLDGPFEAGSTGVLKPKGGPRTKFVIAELTDDRFVDVSRLAGARMTFSHFVEETRGGGTKVQVTVTLSGPLSHLWNLILGNGIKATLQQDLDSLKAVAEASSARGLA
ncbi:SRPBCC family protein [Streptomyces caniscabiei]|uniref:SRPBCC family protein n=1 Tax=Streptomyces caniscabiei TaxID=2746961 RepID=UPI0007660D58|nr:SRPBCC family protein [Streptomyces caniscabiei]